MRGTSANTAALASHNSRHRQRFLVISNDQGPVDERSFFTIEKRNALPGFSLSHSNAALERIFPQLQALGQMVDARNLDEVSDCLRATCMPG